MVTRCMSLVWRTPSLTAFHDGSRRISTVTSARPGPTFWHRQVLGPSGVALCFGVLAASSSLCPLRGRPTELIRQVSGLGPLFGG